MACIIDTVYMIVLPNKEDPILIDEIVYSAPAKTATECWKRYEADRDKFGDYIFGTGMDRKALQRRGFRARQVQICVKQ